MQPSAVKQDLQLRRQSEPLREIHVVISKLQIDWSEILSIAAWYHPYEPV